MAGEWPLLSTHPNEDARTNDAEFAGQPASA
jgi:hypothetical protein